MTALPVTLPNGFVHSVETGESVIVGQIIATKSAQIDEIINIPSLLSVGLREAGKCIKKIPGEAVKVGDVLAVKSSMFGTKKIVLKSKVEGTVTRFERDSGNLVIKTLTDTQQDILSPVDGIVGICDNSRIVINTDKNVLIGILANGENATGIAYVLPEDDAYHINAQTIGKIVISEVFTREMIIKAIGIGVSGIIGTEINAQDIEYIKHKNLSLPIIKIEHNDLDRLKDWNSKNIFVDPEAKSVILLSV